MTARLVHDGPIAVVGDLGHNCLAVFVAGDESQVLAEVEYGQRHDHAVLVAQLDCVLPHLRGQVKDVNLGWRDTGGQLQQLPKRM